MVVMAAAALLFRIPGLWLGVIYAAGYLGAAIFCDRAAFSHPRPDLTHEPGPLTTIPSRWRVNRSYHWRHHFS